jgi:hypothetical protein
MNTTIADGADVDADAAGIIPNSNLHDAQS